MISLSANHLSLQFGVQPILDRITFSLEENDRVGIVGVNGCGKSTLLRLIAGKYTPDAGEIYIGRGKTIGLLEQDDTFLEIKTAGGTEIGNTILEQMYAAFPQLLSLEARLQALQEQLDRAHASSSPGEEDALMRLTAEFTTLHASFLAQGGLEFRTRCASILRKLGFAPECHHQPISSLSGGQRTRLALARLLCQENDILMLDEPTNHLDIDAMQWLEEYLSGYKKTLIIVSHDRYFLDRVTGKTLELEHHRAKLYGVPYSQYLVQKEADRAEAEKHYRLQQKEIARIESYIEQQRAWGRERNIIAAESREKALNRMEKLERPAAAPQAIRFRFQDAGESGNDVLDVRGLSMGYGSRTLFRDLSFSVKKREHVFITGANGCGKSTLMKILMGFITPTAGKIVYGYNVQIGYYDQENQRLSPQNTVLEELWEAYPTLTQTEIRDALALFLFRGDDVSKRVSALSGGERARLTLTKMVLGKMNLLILDEPTNHLDIQSREVLEAALQQFNGTIIAVSHDRYFTGKLATRLIDIGAQNGPIDFRGTYSEYLAYRASSALTTASGSKQEYAEESDAKAAYRQAKQDAAARRKAEKQKQQQAKETAALEKELEQVEQELYGEAATDYVRAAELEERRQAIEGRLLELYALEEEGEN